MGRYGRSQAGICRHVSGNMYARERSYLRSDTGITGSESSCLLLRTRLIFKKYVRCVSGQSHYFRTVKPSHNA